VSIGSLVRGTFEIVLGSAAIVYCWLALRGGRSIRMVATSVLRTYRRPITDANIRGLAPFLKIAMACGLVLGFIFILSGLLTIVRGI
jgi:hypothetical protein